jgi:hypothetical protein
MLSLVVLFDIVAASLGLVDIDAENGVSGMKSLLIMSKACTIQQHVNPGSDILRLKFSFRFVNGTCCASAFGKKDLDGSVLLEARFPKDGPESMSVDVRRPSISYGS